MRYVRYCLWMFVVAAVAVVACKQEQEISQEPPLLLENGDRAQELPTSTGPVADNSRCHVCHINYEDEELAVVHARANINCEQCHGSCDAHCNDEDNITPPDIMYPMAKIKPFCTSCHPNEKISVAVHKAVLGDNAKGYCTDCHGEHRLGYRTRRWDKATGELIDDDKVRMMTDEMVR